VTSISAKARSSRVPPRGCRGCRSHTLQIKKRFLISGSTAIRSSIGRRERFISVLGGDAIDLVIMTKVGMEMPGRGKGLSPAWIKRSVEDSLKRLQTDYIDLYQAHQDDPTTPLLETLAAFADLIGSGKVRAIGASNYSAERLEEALATSRANKLPPYVSLQPHYNLLERPVYEDALEAVCLRHQLGVIPYYSLASGFLTGKYRSTADLGKSTVRGPSAAKYLEGKGPKVLVVLDEVASATVATPTQVALAWLMARPSVTAPIASASKPEQLGDLVKAATLKLSPAQIEALNSASSKSGS
jgi:aryl-alcohol dehydrogenase-like predicted oxidoreductase